MIIIRSSGMYGARTLLRQQKLPYRFAAREGRSPDRQICRGVLNADVMVVTEKSLEVINGVLNK